MLEYPTAIDESKAFVLEPGDVLPIPDRVRTLYADCETEGLHPYRGEKTCGWAVTWDDHPHAYYVPLRHMHERWNVDGLDQLRRLFQLSQRWVNHNVKFDAHFASESDQLPHSHTELWDTLTLAKTVDSDRWTHGLKPLCRDWCDLPMDEEHDVSERFKEAKGVGGYAIIPADVLGRYAAMDVLGNRELFKYIVGKAPDEFEKLWNIETQLTRTLWRMERRGLRINVEHTMRELHSSITRLLELQDLVSELLGFEVEMKDGNAFYKEILLNQLGLPVIKRTKDGPSFDKEALKIYNGLPEVVTNTRVAQVVRALTEFRTEVRFKGLFLESFLDKVDETGRLHPSYTQTIRTGRMACSDPNSQQFNPRAKELIVPEEGHAFFGADASQMEFRLIAHYIRDESVIDAYANDADTDFHTWVANLCGIGRSPGKTMNFAMAYGAGKRRVMQTLAADDDIIREVSEIVDAEIENGSLQSQNRQTRYRSLCTARAEEIFARYHERLPGLATTSNKASGLAARRGWIRNAYKRRRHLPRKACYKAFNSLVQGCAMDVIKDGMVRLDNAEWFRNSGAYLLANVHDEVLIGGPTEVIEDGWWQRRVTDILENPSVQFRVPFRWDVNTSRKNWKEAKP